LGGTFEGAVVIGTALKEDDEAAVATYVAAGSEGAFVAAAALAFEFGGWVFFDGGQPRFFFASSPVCSLVKMSASLELCSRARHASSSSSFREASASEKLISCSSWPCMLGC
jgi:hypothetical protein